MCVRKANVFEESSTAIAGQTLWVPPTANGADSIVLHRFLTAGTDVTKELVEVEFAERLAIALKERFGCESRPALLALQAFWMVRP